MSAKQTIFDGFREDLQSAGLSTQSEHALICPLCWKETPFDDLSMEHIVPGSVGGTSKEVLTCTHCNNEHGRLLDSQLAEYQKHSAALSGDGTIPVRIAADGKHGAANLQWDEILKLHLVKAASNPRLIESFIEDLRAGKEFTVRIPTFSKARLNTALLRTAYLILFKCFGYHYVKHEVAQALRQRIMDADLETPPVQLMVWELGEQDIPVEHQHLVASCIIRKMQLYFVIIRLQLPKSSSTKYCAVLMPHESTDMTSFVELLEHSAEEFEKATWTIPPEYIFK